MNMGKKYSITVGQEEIKNEIQKQVKSMPGQEKIVYDYYQKKSICNTTFAK